MKSEKVLDAGASGRESHAKSDRFVGNEINRLQKGCVRLREVPTVS